ncbi:MAG: replication-associated recombination protein A [Armatimonadetes bacterium]|nr:replication-associated recombination protein A [Armatimonadota bacterium]
MSELSPPPHSLFMEDEPTPLERPMSHSGVPLAARMRPRTLEEFAGQSKVVGEGTLLRRAIERDQLTYILFWGPPGCGKSTLARIIAHTTRAHFEDYSAITSGVADVRKVIEAARERRKKLDQKTILFVDEIHRWNKAQQDALLPHVEEGTILLIGATTENPYFEVNAPLLSRSRLFRFEPLSPEEIYDLLQRAIKDTERGLGNLSITIDDDALLHLADIAGGDCRKALTALEAAVEASPIDANGERHLTLELAEEGAQIRALGYDKSGDEHYDTASAFIQSLRGSDADASLYWLAKMLQAGEDVKFIARRLVILASEDIGCADPMSLILATSTVQAVMMVGMPEARLILAQTTIHLATAPKSNSATLAIGKALDEIRNYGAKPVPPHLCDGNSVTGRALRKGRDYLYPHEFPNHHVEQQYLPDGVTGVPFYEPTEQGHEAKIKRRLERLSSAEAGEGSSDA